MINETEAFKPYKVVISEFHLRNIISISGGFGIQVLKREACASMDNTTMKVIALFQGHGLCIA